MRALTAHDCCLLQPFCYRVYLPAVISPDKELPLQPGGRVVVAIALAGGEAEALFAPGQRFTIWADAVVDRTIRPEGLVGYGVICGREAPSLLCQSPPMSGAINAVRSAGSSRSGGIARGSPSGRRMSW
jgi:hypothetical protein